MDKWKVMIFVIVLLASAMPVHALEKGGFTFQLVKSYADLPQWVLDRWDDPVYYTPYGLETFNMPILFKKNTAGDLSFDKSDFSSYYRHLIGTTGMDRIKFSYLANETYQKVTGFVCDQYGTGTLVNGSNYSMCLNGHDTFTLDWRLVLKDVPSNINIVSGRWYLLNLEMHKKATTKYWAVDVVPMFKTIDLYEYAWLNSSFTYQANISSNQAPNRNESIYFFMNSISGWSRGQMQSDCDDVRISNASGTEELDYYVDVCNTTHVRIGFLNKYNVSGVIAQIYWSYASAEGENKSMRMFYDDFDDNSINWNNWNYTQGCVSPAGKVIEQGGVLNQTIGIGGACGLIWYSNLTSLRHEYLFAKVKPLTTGSGMVVGLKINSQNKSSNDARMFGRIYNNPQQITFLDEDIAWGGTASYYFNTGTWYWLLTYANTNNYYGRIWNATYENMPSANQLTQAWTSRTGWFGCFLNDDAIASFDDFQVWDEDYLPTMYANSSALTMSSAGTLPSGTTFINWNTNSSTNPATYSTTTLATFNVTWNSSHTYNASLRANFSGSWLNYTPTFIGNRTTYSINLGAGSYQFYWYANNSQSDVNNTQNVTFTIGKASQSCSVSSNSSTSVQYATSINITGTCTITSGNLYRWDMNTGTTSEVSNPYNAILGSNVTVGYRMFNFTMNTTGNANYSAATYKYNMTTTPAISAVTMLFNGISNQNYTLTEGIALNVTSTGKGVVYIFMDGILKNNSFVDGNNLNAKGEYLNSTFTPGMYAFKVNSSGNMENVTTNSTGLTFYVNVTQGLTLTIPAVYDEKTLSPLTFNVSLFNSSYSQSYYNILSFTNSSFAGDIMIVISSSGYIPRNYYVSLGVNGTANITGYLLSSVDGVYITYWAYSTANPIGEYNSYHVFRRFIGSGYVSVGESKADIQGKGTVFLDPYTNYKIDSETSDGSQTYNISSYNPNPSFILRINFASSTGGVNLSWLFFNVNYSLMPENVYLKPNNITGNITLFNYTVLSSETDLEWYALKLIYWNGTVLYSANNTAAGGGSLAVNLNYTSLNGTLIAQTYFKRSGYDLYTTNRTYIIWRSSSAIPDALTYLQSGSGLPVALLSLIAIAVSFGIASITNRVVRTGSGLIYLAILTIFGLYTLFGSDPSITWRILLGLWLMEFGILMYREVW